MATFADLAVELKMIALREAAGVEAAEFLAAQSGAPEFAIALREAKITAQRAGDAYELLKELIPHEEAVRELLGGAVT